MDIRRNIGAFSPVLLLGLALCVSVILFNYIVAPGSDNSSFEFAAHTPTVSPRYVDVDNKEYVQSFEELKQRMLWGISVLFFVLAYIINLYIVVQVLLKSKAHRRWLFILSGLLIISMVIGFVVLPTENHYTFNNDLLQPFHSNKLIRIIVDVIEYAGALMLFILAFSCFLILRKVKSENIKQVTFDMKANILGRYDRHVRLLLYGATLTLIAGTLHSVALYNWSLTMIDPGVLVYNSRISTQYYDNASQVSGAIGAINGLFYSLLIVSIFAPTFAILRKKSKALAFQANPNKSYPEMQKWLKEKNLDQGFSEQILPIISTLGPAIIGGPLIALLEVI